MDYLCGALNSRVNCYTLEVSFHGYHQRQRSNTSSQASKSSTKSPSNINEPIACTSMGPIVQYNQQSYMNLGRNVAKAIFEYYKSIGHIPANLPQSATSGGGGSGGSNEVRRQQPGGADVGGKRKAKVGGASGMTRSSFLPSSGSITVTDTMLRATATQAVPKKTINHVINNSDDHSNNHLMVVNAKEIVLRSI
ncbi:hypothetical protein CHUAL_006331 [Chamberlinius hualienensis]